MHIASDGTTANYFEVAYVLDDGEIKGMLWIGQGPIVQPRMPDATLVLMTSQAPWNPDQVELRLWRGGTVKLQALSIAEAASDLAGTVAARR